MVYSGPKIVAKSVIMDFFEFWLEICFMVSLWAKHDIVRSDIQEITLVLNLKGIASWNSGLCSF